MKVAVNNFVRRQIKNSGKTYSEELSFEFFAKHAEDKLKRNEFEDCLLYTSPSPRDKRQSRMPSSA